MDTEQIYHNAVAAIVRMAIAEQKKINADPEHDTERIKAYRIALSFLRPDLTSEERMSHYKWNCKTRHYDLMKG